MIEYKILKHVSSEILEEQVNKLCGLGWEPLGGPTFTFNDSGNYINIFQAMVRKTEETKSRDKIAEGLRWLTK